jgi:hypothetical protein
VIQPGAGPGGRQARPTAAAPLNLRLTVAQREQRGSQRP